MYAGNLRFVKFCAPGLSQTELGHIQLSVHDSFRKLLFHCNKHHYWSVVLRNKFADQKVLFWQEIRPSGRMLAPLSLENIEPLLSAQRYFSFDYSLSDQ